MVVFTCNHCGESLQKPKVEKHYSFVCRRVKNLTCVDCFKDFRGDEYAVHIKCCTEEERYAAKGAHPNGIVKKGDVKQESWLNQVRAIIDKETNLTPALKNLLNTISQYNNIPRKKKKFINFLTNCMGRRVNTNDIEAAWDIIEKHTKNNAVNQSKEGSENANAIHETNNQENAGELSKENQSNNLASNEEVKSKKKKRKQKLENADSCDNVECNNKEYEVANNELVDCKKKKRKQVIKNGEDFDHIEIDKDQEKSEQTMDNEYNSSNLQTDVQNIESVDVDSNIQIDGKKKKRKKTLNIEENGVPIKSAKVAKIEELQINACEPEEANTLDVKEIILATLERKGSCTLKKLEKAVISSYKKQCGEDTDVDSIKRKIQKKLKKIPIETIEDKIYLKQVN